MAPYVLAVKKGSCVYVCGDTYGPAVGRRLITVVKQ